MEYFVSFHDSDFKEHVRRVIRSEGVIGEDVTIVQSGSDNNIVLVGDSLTLRYPRTKNAVKRLAFEADILQKLHGHIKTLQVPVVRQVFHNPAAMSLVYIAGGHLTDDQIRGLPNSQQQSIGNAIADFLVEFQSILSGSEVQTLRQKHGIDTIDEPWGRYFERLFEKIPLADERIRPLVNQYYAEWRHNIVTEDRSEAIHDDLHTGNLLFIGERLTAILDFGDVNKGGVEEELRWLYGMGEEVLSAAIKRYYVLTSQKIDIQHVRVWAIMHELSTYASRLLDDDTSSYPFKRATAHLRQWLTDFPR